MTWEPSVPDLPEQYVNAIEDSNRRLREHPDLYKGIVIHNPEEFGRLVYLNGYHDALRQFEKFQFDFKRYELTIVQEFGWETEWRNTGFRDAMKELEKLKSQYSENEVRLILKNYFKKKNE